MKLPSFIYRSERIGKNGKPFSLYKFRTMKMGIKTSFADEEVYTKYGKFLRKYKIDELLQIINWLKGDMSLVGPRPDFQETIELLPDHVKKTLLSVKPGLTSISSVHFFDEERILQEAGEDKFKNYYLRVKPAKILLDVFYIQHKCFLLDLSILWLTFKKIVHEAFNRER